MKLTSLHTHSIFCDGVDEIENICCRAFEEGVEILGFSSHAPLPPDSGLVSEWHMKQERLDPYLDAIRDARRRWEGRLKIYLGLEVDYIKGIMGPADRLYRSLGLDYTIGAVHYVIPPNSYKPFTVDGPPEELRRGIREGFGGDGRAVLKSYWEAVTEMIDAGGFEILAHLDLVKKNNRNDEWFPLNGEEHLTLAENALNRIPRDASMAAEVNTGGMNRKKTADPYPSLPILRLLRRRNIPAFISSDAHSADHLTGHYGDGRRHMLEAGYTVQSLFAGTKDGKPEWLPDPL